MRVTSSMYYKSIFGEKSASLNEKLFDVNKQIASGLNIQYAKDDVRTFTETMRLDNEIATLGQVKNSTQNALKMSDQTDVILVDFEESMKRARTLLISAGNETNSKGSLDAISKELRGIETHLKNLANTSVNGQYLFSGSALNTKPIANDGTYMGNDALLKAFTGSKTSQQYNITGEKLFLGEKSLATREVTTNVIHTNLSIKYPDYTDATVVGKASVLTPENTIRDLMGDADNAVDVGNPKHYFYVRGTNSSGNSFEQKITLSDDDNVSDLLDQIGNLYGNTPNLDVVNVSMNSNGQIVIADKITGSSKIDFHIVGATDLSGGVAANVTNIDDLGLGEPNFDKIMLGTSTATNPSLHVKEFIKSSYTSADSVAATNSIEGTIYDRTEFAVNGARLSSTSPQIVKGTNAFATESTKISDVATTGSLNGVSFELEGVNVNGVAYSVQIDFATAGSTFTVGGNTYSIFDVGTPRAAVDADDMTYGQLMDVMNMVVTNSLPAAAPGSAAQYDAAADAANLKGKTFLSYDGKIGFEEVNVASTQARIALYDSNSGDFSNPASVMTFNTNNALTVTDPKTDFFKSFSEIAEAVENYKLYPDNSSGNARNIGIENAIAALDGLEDHISSAHSQVGAQTNALTTSLERTELLEMSSISLRSSVLDTDLAEASLKLAQLNINFEAMLSTAAKVSQLSLVNYL